METSVHMPGWLQFAAGAQTRGEPRRHSKLRWDGTRLCLQGTLEGSKVKSPHMPLMIGRNATDSTRGTEQSGLMNLCIPS